jgi:hypothetical protein
MKKTLTPILLAVALLGFGCTKPSGPMTHAALTAAIATGEQFALLSHPEVAPDLRAGADVVCAVANGTNASPEAIVAALTAANITNSESRLILNFSLALFDTATASITNTAAFKPWAVDLCNGMTAGLPTNSGHRNRAVLLPPHLLP